MSPGQWFDNRWIEGEAAGTEWVAHFDNTEWEPGDQDTSWSGDSWEASVGSGEYFWLKAIGSWATGYRPNKIRITFDENTTSADNAVLYLEDTEDNYIVNGQTIYVEAGDGAPTEVTITFEGYNIDELWWEGTNDDYEVTNIEFEETIAGGIDLTVVSSSWWNKLRPKKFRMTFDNATADVSLRDSNGVEIYANATYASGEEVYLAFSGADIARLVVSGSGDITDIEVSEQVEKGSMPERTPYQPSTGKTPPGITAPARLPRRPGLRTLRRIPVLTQMR